ncbi:MAG: sensor domain-containing diguanylate cyclase [Spirochaetes bacterium]|nr:sensor domain-containing diguanylate cyclase [Spirochaetota bacterium]MBU1081477.1 sensor domain-containing diguanylate cyclase [Spirochaetota bacterium]
MENSEIDALRDEYEKQLFDLKQLLEISKSLNSTLDYGILIESILYIIMGQMRVLKAALYAKKGIDSTRFSLHRNYKGFDIDHEHDYGIPDDVPAIRLFARETRCWTLDELRARFGDLGGLEPLESMGPCLVVPLKAKGVINGLLLLGEQILSDDFSDYDKDYLLNIAILASIAINNAFLFEMTTTDMMTKLRMKHYFYTVLVEKMEESAFSEKPLSVIMCDIDFFKKFNDAYGHSCGDEVLKSVAKLIQNQTRSVDVAARYGGEEFCMLLPDTDSATAWRIAERIRTHVEGMGVDYDGQRLSVTLSLGVAQYDPDRDLTAKSVIDRADKAMYLSKQNGRNMVSAAR